MPGSDLAALRVLIAEDEFLIATDLAEAFESEGAQVLGPASSVKTAMALLETTPAVDCGVLDLNLGGELVYPLADALARRDVPFLFTTGYDDGAIPSRFDNVIRLPKPTDGAAAVEQARQLLLRGKSRE